MGEILDIAEALWKGEKDTTSYHPFGPPTGIEKIAHDWSVALREMVALNPEVLAPGHGFPILGADRVKQALEDTASFLESTDQEQERWKMISYNDGQMHTLGYLSESGITDSKKYRKNRQ